MTPVRERVIMALGRKTNAVVLPGLPVAENNRTWPDAPPSPVLLDRSTVASGRRAARRPNEDGVTCPSSYVDDPQGQAAGLVDEEAS